MPARPKTGRNTSTMMTVANTIDDRISSVASRTTTADGRRSASGLALFSRRRRTTFSTSMIASSTSAPMAIAMPPSVIVLMPTPNARSASTAAASDSGIAVSVMAPARRFARNSSTITMTRMPPSRSAVDHVVDRDLDEVGLPEDPPVDRHPARQFRLQACPARDRGARSPRWCWRRAASARRR